MRLEAEQQSKAQQRQSEFRPYSLDPVLLVLVGFLLVDARQRFQHPGNLIVKGHVSQQRNDRHPECKGHLWLHF